MRTRRGMEGQKKGEMGERNCRKMDREKDRDVERNSKWAG